MVSLGATFAVQASVVQEQGVGSRKGCVRRDWPIVVRGVVGRWRSVTVGYPRWCQPAWAPGEAERTSGWRKGMGHRALMVFGVCSVFQAALLLLTI